MARTTAQIEQSLAQRINARNPSLDTVKGAIPEAMIIPQAAEIQALEQRQDSIGMRYSFEYVKTQDRDTQILYGANHGLRPSRGTPSICRGVAYRFSRPTENVVITAGKIVSTDDESISFRTLYDAVMYIDRVDAYYNAARRRYEVPVTLVSIGTGAAFEIPPLTVRKLREPVVGIDGIENTMRASDSNPEESLPEFGVRVQRAFNGLDKSSSDGLSTVLRNLAPTLVRNVIPIFSSDTQYFQRRTRRASWDVYIRGERLEDTEDTFMSDGSTSVFTLSKPPARDVLEVRIGGLPTTFTFTPDSRPEVKGSSQAEDKISFPFVPAPGATIVVKYTWNSLIGQLQDYINQRRNKPYRTDTLIREAQPLMLRMRFDVQPTSTFDSASVLDDVRRAVYTYLDEPVSREVLSPEIVRAYILQTVTGIRTISVRVFTKAELGTLDVETIELAPYEYGATTDVLLTTVRV